MRSAGFAIALALAAASARGAPAAAALQDANGGAWTPTIAPASDEAAQAIARAHVPKGYQVTLFAAEPRLANPVGFTIDSSGVFYVAETFRLHDGVFDLRDHMDWADEDLAARSHEDHVEMLRHRLGAKFAEIGRAADRVRWIADTDGDGVADADRVLDDGFREPGTGLGAAVLARKGEVYYTNIPNLWLLGDPKRDGHLEKRKILHHGFGIHTAMVGHDLHGLRIGPDGRLYFSSGDRAFRVDTGDGVIDHTHTGAVLRCELDGSRLEVYASGLRNPQDLAFDELGNLFTGDNNCDGGDRARWVHVVEGSDSGYRYGYQWMEDPYLRGPWNDEKLWHPRFAGQAAYIVPPVSWLGSGPSGITYDPGTGLDPENRKHFFTCDFGGDAGNSALFRFTTKTKGAGFEIGPVEKFLTGALPTDVEFGPDGALYWLDWVHGWRMTGKGRIYKISHPSAAADPLVAQTQRILRDGFDERSLEELGTLLAHADQRVRQESELELAGRGSEGAAVLARAAREAGPLLARLHGIWGLGLAARRGVAVDRSQLSPLLRDAEAEVRGRAAELMGEWREASARGELVSLLKDPSARVRAMAAIALSKTGGEEAVEPLLALLRETAETDPVLRHAAIVGLSGCASGERLAAVAGDPSVDARVAAVVALRRKRDPLIERYLGDADARVATEAARAVYDLPIAPALTALAARLDERKAGSDALTRRALAAALRVGGEENVRRLAQAAMRAEIPQKLRVVAFEHLGHFNEPPGRDAICGEWRPIARTAEEKEAARAALAKAVDEIAEAGIDGAAEPLAIEWLALVEQTQRLSQTDRVARWSTDAARGAKLRGRTIGTLEKLRPADLGARLRAALADASVEVRVAALEAIRRTAPEETLPAAKTALESATIPELRFAYDAFAKLATSEADGLLRAEMEKWEAGLVPSEVRLDLWEAAEERLPKDLAALAPSRAAARRLDPALAPWLDAVAGGDAARGRHLFKNNASISCLRCHKGDDGEGGLVGPDLRGLGKRATRLAILASIVDPNRRLAAGYQGTALELKKGGIVAGRVEKEEGGKIYVRRSDDQVQVVDAEEVADRFPDRSAMPDGLAAFLKPREMRDLIEYLAGLQ